MAAAAVGKVAEKQSREKRRRASKAPKGKKPATPKSAAEKKRKASTLSHPPYFQMIKEAILALHERTGSSTHASTHAIAKYLEEKYSAVLPPNFKKTLSVQLWIAAAKGKLVRVKVRRYLLATSTALLVTN